jgi:hypothetical protein
MPKATTSVDGYLSATDWTTFNGKSNTTGTVTSVAATVPSFLSVSGSPITSSGTLALTYSGTALPVLNGGTGVTSFTANQIHYGSFSQSANLTFNGTSLTLANDASISGLTVGKGGGASALNTALGLSTLSANTSGVDNTAVGRGGLNANTTGSDNIAVGFLPLLLNTTGSYNTGLGSQSLYNNTTASWNSAVGYQAGYLNTTGTANSFFGSQVGYSTTTGGANAAFGANLSGVALSTFVSNTTGSYNTAFGVAALASNTTASNNTAVGYQAGYSNTTGTWQAMFGYQAGYATTTGSGNAFYGYQAGLNNTTGVFNVFVGRITGTGITTGYSNTIVGDNAGSGFTTGSVTNNSFFGSGSGSAITSGSSNTIIGCYTGNQGGLDIRTASNYIVLSDGSGNPNLYLDNNKDIFVPKVYVSTTASAANMFVTSGGQFVRSTSALKYKQDIRDLEFIDINKFRPVRYKSKSEGDDQTLDHFGIIADEVDQAGIKELVSYGAEGEVEGFQYERLTVVLLKTIQDLQKRIEILESK